MKIALIQFDILPGEVQLNEQTAAKLITEAAANGAEVVALPELWNMGYDLAHLPDLAQTPSGSSIKVLQKIAKKHGIMIFGGTIGEKKANKFYNTQMIINPHGEIIYKYRKIHLFPLGLEEEKYFESGDEWGICETPWGNVGLITCYDLRFPELMRNLALRGVKAILIPAQWPEIRIDHWQILNQSRAIENQVYIFAINRTGEDASGKYAGCSMIINPWGKIVAGGNDFDKQGIIMADIDFSVNQQVAEILPVFNNRRRILDEIDDGQL